MAITSGVGPHAAWLNVSGTSFPVERGSVTQEATRKTSSFQVRIPMSLPGAADALAWVGDNDATITVLARGQTSTLFTGEIKEVTFDYIGRTISVRGQDKSGQLHQNKSSEKFQNQLNSDVVSDIVGRVGLAGNVFPSQLMAGKKLEQDFVKLSDNVSFSQLIHKMSELDGNRYYVDPDGQFHYEPFGSSTRGAYSININQDQQPISSDCLVLKVTRNVEAGKTVEVGINAWHPKLKHLFQNKATVPGNGGPHLYNFNLPTQLQDHVDKHATSKANEYARGELTVHATVVGDPAVSAGMDLQLSGTQFDQTFDIDTVHHEFGMGGYRTSIVARSAKQGRSASLSGGGAPAASSDSGTSIGGAGGSGL